MLMGNPFNMLIGQMSIKIIRSGVRMSIIYPLMKMAAANPDFFMDLIIVRIEKNR